MNRFTKFAVFCLVFAGITHCAKKRTNIEKTLVDQVIVEFTEARLAHYLRGGSSQTNAEILEKVLSRHGLRLLEFRPAFRRFQPEIEGRILKS